MWPGESFYLPDPCELTFANTLLLSNAAISLGNAFINLEISSQYIIFFTLWSFYLSSVLLVCRLKNFVFSHIQLMIHFIVVFSFSHSITFLSFNSWYFTSFSYLLFLYWFRSYDCFVSCVHFVPCKLTIIFSSRNTTCQESVSNFFCIGWDFKQ